VTDPLGAKAGEAFITFRADTHITEDVQKDLAETEAVVAVEGEVIGHTLGQHISEGMKKEVDTQGPSIAREIEQAVAKETIRPKPKFSLRGIFGGSRGRSQSKEIAKGIETVVEDAVDKVASPGGPIDRLGNAIGSTFSDGIGAVFNVSGKSPLIALLIPLFAELGVLIGGLVQALGPLLGLLTTLPAIIGGIALSVGVLFLAFHGLGTAIQGAFAATNAKELNEALKGLMPSAQAFVRELVNARDVFKQLSQDAQQAFFAQLTGKLTSLIHDLSLLFHNDLENLAVNLGQFFGKLIDFFNSPSMKIFLTELFPATMRWIQGFGTGLVDLLTGLIDLATASLPFLSTIGADLNSVFSQLGKYFTKLSKDPTFTKWLDSMEVTFDSLLGVLKQAGIFIAVFLDSLDKAGGEKFLQTLADQLLILSAFFSSDAGIHALTGLIDTLIFLGDVFIGLVLIVGFIFASLEEFFEWLTGTAIPAVGDFFGAIGKGIADFREPSNKFFEDLAGTVIHALDIAGAAVRSFVFGIGNWFADAGSWLYNAGKDLINGLWRGIQSTGVWIKQKIMDWVYTYIPAPVRRALGISSPSKVFAEIGKQTAEGFAVGFDDQFQKNATNLQASMGDLTADVSASTSTSNVGFGQGAIQISFNGQLPTQAQASEVGAAVGMGITNQLAARNARLAVRTL
jgi:hypothetical protein